MRWAVLVTAILMIVFLMEPLAHMVVIKANPFNYPTVTIESPKYNIHTASIPIEVIAYPHKTSTVFTKIVYSLDGTINKTLVISTIPSSSGFFGKGSLDNLAEGFHTFDVYSFDSQGNVMHSNTTFQVEIKAYNEHLIIDAAIVSSIFAIFAAVTVIIYRRWKLTSKKSLL
jgi:hypothetical protein